ncbi:hypothetical protein Tsubulata_020146 [Turnera subulata]|uniref:Mesoderm development candidate 2 n=1 Tax=Turnera subulata TaxID=218843 RepID=A0A9Q0JJS9_9ROSI|nr:hypothetical protein Tsubulata_020146 [Turnera subulata]
MNPNFLTILLLLPLLFSPNGDFVRVAEGGKRRIHITDELDDVVDDEEDEAWKQWGQKPKPADRLDPPPSDLSRMSIQEIQEMMMKSQTGPVFGFVKLRLGVRRTPDMVEEIARKWTKVLRTAAVEVHFMTVDISTIMFNIPQGQNMMEVKEFILNEDEAYEVKIGDQVFRRPGDPPLDQVMEKLRGEKGNADDLPNFPTSAVDAENVKEEL